MDAVKKTARMDTKKLATLAMLTALAYVVMYLSKLMPSVNGFLDFDFKDVVLCIGGFVYGPIAALMMIVIVCVLEMVTVSHTDIIGCIMNIVATASFVCTACAIYKRKHTMKGAIVGLASAVVVLVVVMLAWNYFLTPIYQKIPREAVAAMLPTVFLSLQRRQGRPQHDRDAAGLQARGRRAPPRQADNSRALRRPRPCRARSTWA